MFTSMVELVKTAAGWGLSPFMIPNKNLIMTFTCPHCKSPHMIKFIKKPDLRNKIHACKDCGYRYMTPGYKKNHGTFITGTLNAKAKAA